MKKNHFTILCLIMICSGMITLGCATGIQKAPWTTSDSILLSTALALHGSDWMQTKDGVINKGLEERNMFLSGNPNEQDIDLYFVSTAAGMSALSVNVSKEWRTAILIGWCFLELICVMNNDYSAGFRVNIQR